VEMQLMGFQPYQPIEEIEVRQPEVDKTYKTYWDHSDGCWKNTWIYRIRRKMEGEFWLKNNYKDQYNSGPTGWQITFDHLVMSEKIYLHYCLVQPG
jgi:hypothetical protein